MDPPRSTRTGGWDPSWHGWWKVPRYLVVQARPSFSTKILRLKVEDTWWTPNRRGGLERQRRKKGTTPTRPSTGPWKILETKKARWRIVQGSISRATRTTKRVLVERNIRANLHPQTRERNMGSSGSEEENEGGAVNEPGQSKGSDVTEPIYPNGREFLLRMQIVGFAKGVVGHCRHDGRNTPRKSES